MHTRAVCGCFRLSHNQKSMFGLGYVSRYVSSYRALDERDLVGVTCRVSGNVSSYVSRYVSRYMLRYVSGHVSGSASEGSNMLPFMNSRPPIDGK